MMIKGGLIKPDVLTVTGKTIDDNVSGVQVLNKSVIRPLDKPYLNEGRYSYFKGEFSVLKGL